MSRTGPVLAAVLLVAASAVACSDDPAPRPGPDLRGDATVLGRHLEESHADLGELIPSSEWRAAVRDLAEREDGMEPDTSLVELMRLAALPGRTSGGDGHSGIFPLDDHERELHLFPLRLYEFPEGFFVVDAPGHEDLVGARLVAIGDTPVEEIAGLVEPLVPRDNDMTVKARLPQFLVVAEVLHGLAVTEGSGAAVFDLETESGSIAETIEPVPAPEYADATGVWHPMIPPSLPRPGGAEREWRSAYLAGEDVVLVEYEQTTGDSFALGRRVVALVRRHDARGVVLDLRRNPGGENSASAGLLEALGGDALRGVPLAVLVGRGTFSAAGYLSLHLQRDAAPLFVGEPTGFSTRFFGDPVSETLPAGGLVVNAGGVEWDEGVNGSYDSPLQPDLDVAVTAEQYFADEDPVLSAAIARLRRD